MVEWDPRQPDQVNWSRFDPSTSDGCYESYYLRGNHPTQSLAFWIRYTNIRPDGRPRDALGELWAIVFDGSTGSHVSEKVELPITDCSFARDEFAVRVGDATLADGALRGRTGSIGWDLRYRGSAPPLYLLPPGLYRGGFPKAKSLVPRPSAAFTGSVSVGGRTIDVDGWRGSQNHNWGSRHTDHYAFGQVAGFDNAPDSFLEVATARNRIAGPLWIPAMTPVVLRHGGREYAINSLGRMARAKATMTATAWTFSTGAGGVSITGEISAPPEAFVHLRYRNPPGGLKHCHNTKLARCTLTLVDLPHGVKETLVSEHGALFEILDDHAAS